MRSIEHELELKYQEAKEKLEASQDQLTDLQAKIEELNQLNDWEKQKQEEIKINNVGFIKREG